MQATVQQIVEENVQREVKNSMESFAVEIKQMFASFQQDLNMLANQMHKFQLGTMQTPQESQPVVSTVNINTPGTVAPATPDTFSLSREDNNNYPSNNVRNTPTLNIRRLSSTGGVDSRMNRELLSEDTTHLGNIGDASIPRPLSIDEVSRKFSGKDLITNINILWFYANLQSTSRDTSVQSVMISNSESFFLGKLEALKNYRITKFDILHIASKIVKIMDLLTMVRGVDSIPALGFIDSSLKGFVVVKYNMMHETNELDRSLILKFEQASDIVLYQPRTYGLGALIFLVIKCIPGLRDNSAFMAVLKRLSMWIPAVHEGEIYSLNLALQAFQMYHKLFTTILEMSAILFPAAIETYPKHILVGIYRNGLISEHMTSTPFTRVINSLGQYEYANIKAMYTMIMDMFTGNNQEMTSESRIKLTWGETSRRRIQGRQDYVKAHPTLNAMLTAPGFDPLLDALDIPDNEVDEFLLAMYADYDIRNNSLQPNAEDNNEWYEYTDTDNVETDDGYLRQVFEDNEHVEHLNALASLDTPCWMHFGHELFQDPKPCARGKHCKHSHAHNDVALAELYKSRHRDTHLKMMRTHSTKNRFVDRRATNGSGRNNGSGRGHQSQRPPH